MRKQKERVKCPYCGSPVSTRNCDSASFGSRNPTPTVIFHDSGTGYTVDTSGESKITLPILPKGFTISVKPVSSAEKQQREDEKTMTRSEEEKLEARCRAKGIMK